MPATSLGERYVGFCERILTQRKKKIARKRARLKRKNIIVDWIEAFVWAAFVVLLINQYVLQAYQIPTGSMIDTLMEEDRIFVNKAVFGPELLPGIAKLPSPFRAGRNEVVIFENPQYIGRGTAFTIVQRVLYMLTLSMVDIDLDENGNPRAHFLIKRAVGVGGDRFRNRDGDVEFQLPGEQTWISEAEFQALSGSSYHVTRMLSDDDYVVLAAAARAEAARQLGRRLTPEQERDIAAVRTIRYADYLSFQAMEKMRLYELAPHNRRNAAMAFQSAIGWYVPLTRVFPLGDNRDNSRDGRYFGPVRENRVLGQAMFIYWPLNRVRLVE